VVTQNATIAANAVPGVLLAVASPRDHGYALTRMWEALVERVGWETMTFRSVADAESWIRTRLRQKFGIDLAGPAKHPGQCQNLRVMCRCLQVC
jgi:hypothetical protein